MKQYEKNDTISSGFAGGAAFGTGGDLCRSERV
jgi:hypothetical protein